MSYKVTAPLVLAKDKQGHTHHRYEGAVIDWLSDEQEKHLLSEGMVEKADGPSDDGCPAKTAPKADWVDYAVSQGFDQDEVEAMTKQELVDQFG